MPYRPRPRPRSQLPQRRYYASFLPSPPPPVPPLPPPPCPAATTAATSAAAVAAAGAAAGAAPPADRLACRRSPGLPPPPAPDARPPGHQIVGLLRHECAQQSGGRDQLRGRRLRALRPWHERRPVPARGFDIGNASTEPPPCRHRHKTGPATAGRPRTGRPARRARRSLQRLATKRKATVGIHILCIRVRPARQQDVAPSPPRTASHRCSHHNRRGRVRGAAPLQVA